MKSIHAAIYTISRYAAYVSCAICVYMLGHIILEIFIRTTFGTSTFCMDEFVGYAVGTMTFLAMGYSLENGGLIRVNIILKQLDGMARRIVEVFCAVMTLLSMGMVIWYFWVSTISHYVRGITTATYMDVPSWIPEGLFLLGMMIFWIQLLSYLIRVIRGEVDFTSERAVHLGADG
jgi:TRAP-type C4-dicarboxylate transport system permease small subunit